MTLTKIVLEGHYMDYFVMQQYLNELIEGGYISVTDGRTPLYSITANGLLLIRDMINLLPVAQKIMIDRSITAVKNLVKNTSVVTADYYTDYENHCTVKLKIEENNLCALEVNIAVGSKDDARKICKNWEENTIEIYSKIIELLTTQF